MVQVMEIDCDKLVFVSPPSEHLHIKCPVCLELLLDEPFLVSCCGQHFCGKCLSNQSIKSRCPLCGDTSYVHVIDKNHQRTLGSSRVYCLMEKEGCTWEGELIKLKEHLNNTSTDVCQFVTLSCTHNCGHEAYRKYIQNHENTCPKRPMKCQHCGVSSTWESITQDHVALCTQFPIACPYCGETVIRSDLNSHEMICNVKIISCDFAHVGCQWSGQRMSLEQHLEVSWKTHMTLITTDTYRVVQSHEKEMKVVVEMLDKQQTQLSKQETLIRQLKDAINQQQQLMKKFEVSPKNLKEVAAANDKKESKGATNSANKLKSTSQLALSSPALPSVNKPLELKFLNLIIKGFKRHSCEVIESEPFYLCRSLYPCFKFSIRPGTDAISAYLHIVKGKYDEQLTWPYGAQYSITVCLFTAAKRYSHGKVIKFDSTASLEARCKPSTTGNIKGVGFDYFISNSEVLRYVNNEQLLFEISYYA